MVIVMAVGVASDKIFKPGSDSNTTEVSAFT